MGTSRKQWVVIGSLLILLILCCYTIFYVPKVKYQYKEHNREIINPSRGFYVQLDSEDMEDMQDIRKEGITLILLGFDIKEFVAEDISKEKLEELKLAMQEANKQGLKVILRTAYGFGSEYEYKDPDSLEVITSHIRQIAPIINEYANTILCIQAGFLGPWGEWHSSNLLGEDENRNKEVRNQILRTLLEEFEEDIIINVRRPRFLRDAMDAGLEHSRLGLHNDALLSTDNDMGTYDASEYSRGQELSWIKNQVKTGVNGGELPLVSEYSGAENAVLEFNQLHITYLNKNYNTEALHKWKAETIEHQNGYQFISNHLGYRFYLKQVELSKYIKNGTLQIKLELTNSGFSTIEEGYEIDFILWNKRSSYVFPYKYTKLSELANGETLSLKTKIKLPSDLKVDQFYVGLRISEKKNKTVNRNYNSVILASDELMVEDGVNYFALFELQDHQYFLRKLK